MIENDLREYLKNLGASLVGFADLEGIDTSHFDYMKYGISFGIKLNPKIIEGINEGPTREYYEEYNRVNIALDDILESCVKYIKGFGYDAIGQVSTIVASDESLSTPLPHKTVATRAGLGWIGKNALLITPEYGSAIRISSIITSMPLMADTPVNESKCGGCTKCAEACPASAIKGNLWNVNTTRDELINPFKCRKKARALAKSGFGIETSICGKCIEICPYTKRYTLSNGASV